MVEGHIVTLPSGQRVTRVVEHSGFFYVFPREAEPVTLAVVDVAALFHDAKTFGEINPGPEWKLHK